MFGSPGAGALVLLALIAAFSFVMGVLLIVFAIGLGNPQKLLKRAGRMRESGAKSAEEAGARA